MRRVPRKKRPVEKGVPKGYDSKWESELHNTVLKGWKLHTSKVNYVVEHSYTPDFVKISSNHLYAFVIVSIFGYLTFLKDKQIKYLIIYLILLAILLEICHLFIPQRSFQWSDLFGNLLGVFVVIFFKNLINKYGLFKK